MWIARFLLESLIELLIISLLYFRFRKRPGMRLFLLFAGFFLFNGLLLRFPMHYTAVNFALGSWNWSGKLYAIIGSSIWYCLFRNDFAENDFVTFCQQPGSLRPVLLVVGGITLFIVAVSSCLSERIVFDAETLAFQFTMPGFDEELSFRGIMMSLLVTALRPQIRLGRFGLGHPAIWMTAILFGVIHGFSLNKDWQIRINWIVIVNSGFLGWIFGWVALRSRSIVFPTIMHNILNGLSSLLRMLK